MNNLNTSCMSSREQVKLQSLRVELIVEELQNIVLLDQPFTIPEIMNKLPSMAGMQEKTRKDVLHTILRWMEKYHPEKDSQPLACRLARGLWVLPSLQTEDSFALEMANLGM